MRTAVYLWAGAIVNVICNLILIPLFASHGAAIGSIAAEFVITILHIALFKKYMPLNIIFKPMINYLISGIGMFAALLVINAFMPASTIIAVVVKICCGAVVYYVILRLILRDGFLISETRKAISKMVRR